ncbi:MAG: N-acetyl-gamma-glutamyl-phosphate reductase, partial [Clostridia bacterium]|nr:N-acetyl-gamma-glutamyl-phosphate reductase [Clostridia bacterium]
HASGFISLVYPLIAAGLMPKDYPVTCHSVTGYTGGGKKMIADYEGEDRDKALDSPRQYGLTQSHKHLKEMQAITGLSFAPQFSPIVADFPRGMVVTVPLFSKLLKGNPTKQQIHELLSAHYEGQAFVRVLSLDGEEEGIGGLFEANAMEGRNSMEILVTGNDERPLLLSRFDNLGKGASGAAMQCMNIMLGVPEDTGLLL